MKKLELAIYVIQKKDWRSIASPFYKI